jgi:hypothetical protein
MFYTPYIYTYEGKQKHIYIYNKHMVFFTNPTPRDEALANAFAAGPAGAVDEELRLPARGAHSG